MKIKKTVLQKNLKQITEDQAYSLQNLWELGWFSFYLFLKLFLIDVFFSISRQSQESLKSVVFGQGREIPVKEGFIFKKSSSWKTQEWSQKYLTVTNGGNLTYYSSYSAYLDESNAKICKLNLSTVKILSEEISDNRKYIFEVHTNNQQKWTFACDTIEERNAWVAIIKSEIKSSLQVLQHTKFS